MVAGRSSFLCRLLVLIQMIVSSVALTCLNQCAIDGSSPQALVVPNGKCSMTIASACRVRLSFEFGTGLYSATFDTAPVASYTSSMEAQPSNYLSYGASYSCTDSDSCALDFARKKVTELSARKYNLPAISAELASLILQRSQAAGTTLVCADNDVCAGGVCDIEFDTISNSKKTQGCDKLLVNIKVRAAGSDISGSFDVKCNLPNCNTPETLNKAKAIFAKHNLADADGRIVEVGRNDGHGIVASVPIVVGLALFSSIVV